MGTPSKQLMNFMSKFKVDSDEVWEVRSGGAWAIKHAALERVAAEQGIKFALPTFVETNGGEKIVALVVSATMGDRLEWSIGETSPSNYRTTDKMAAYPYAMAEKRAKDRVALKLLNAHGAVYSDSEADDFAQSNGDGKMATLPKKDAREIYAKLQSDVRACRTREHLKKWGELNKDRIAVLPLDWQDILRLQYEEQMADLREQEKVA